VYKLAGHVIAQLNLNVAVFPSPDPTVAALTTENTKLDAAIKAKDGSHQKNKACDAQSLVVFNLLKMELAYVNKIAKGDKANILLSGFDSSNEPSPHEIPDMVVIKRIEDGKAPHSAKIFIEPLNGAEHYKVESTITPDNATSWKTVLDPASLHHLVITGLVRGQETWFRVTGGNSHGWGTPSESVPFLPR
jgi:hypothetical protein